MRLVLLLVLASLAAPAAGASLVVQAPLPPNGLTPAPQLACAIVLDAPGAQRCDVVSGVAQARSVLVSGHGMSTLHVLVVDEAGLRQLHSGPCATTCRIDFDAPVTSPRMRLSLFVEGVGPGAYAAATVQADPLR